ncbi:MAG TPA: hypothetical protein VMI55_06285 [Thermoplasmata archaeon]|nr:hypothetical protein [Thermoplasmata archaeon]
MEAGSDQAVLSRWRRDYRISRAILVVGLVVFGVIVAIDFWADLTGNVPPSGGPGLLALNLFGTAGFALVFVGTLFTFHNGSLLRAANRLTGAPSRR